MRIAFKKVTSQGSEFQARYQECIFLGNFQRDKTQVRVDATLKGKLPLICNRCGDEFIKDIDEVVTLWVNDGVYSGDEIDVIESHDNFVDFDFIAQSEVEAIKADYHYCDKCKDKKGE